MSECVHWCARMRVCLRLRARVSMDVSMYVCTYVLIYAGRQAGRYMCMSVYIAVCVVAEWLVASRTRRMSQRYLCSALQAKLISTCMSFGSAWKPRSRRISEVNAVYSLVSAQLWLRFDKA